MTGRRNQFLRATLAAASVLVVVACGQGASAPASPKSTAAGSIVIRLDGDWTHFNVLDPGTTGLVADSLITSMYDTLVTVGPDPKNPTKATLLPYLADSWEVTPSKLTFKLRRDATCPDGSKITATAVKNSFEKQFKSSRAPVIFGAGPYTMVADDAGATFTLNLGTPFSDAIWGFQGTTGAIVCPSGLANPDSLRTAIAGSGPYQLQSAVHGDELVMTRREDWKWGPNGITAKDLPSKITYKIITNETTAANLLLTGGVDVGRIAGPDVPRLLAEKSLVKKTTTSFFNYALYLNHDPSRPTSDPKVREALVSAIDFNQWNQAANQGRGQTSSSYLMPKADCFDPATANLLVKNPGPDKAKAVLMAAGWTAGANGKLSKDGKPLTVSLLGTNILGIGSGPEYLATQWTQAGITVDARITDFNTYYQGFTKSDFDAFPATLPFDQGNPNRPATGFTGKLPPAGTNVARIVSPQLEAAQAAAEASVGSERCKNWATFQETMLRNFDIWPLASPNVYWFGRGIDVYPGAQAANVRFIRKAAG